jgi:hypothetical protein
MSSVSQVMCITAYCSKSAAGCCLKNELKIKESLHCRTAFSQYYGVRDIKMAIYLSIHQLQLWTDSVITTKDTTFHDVIHRVLRINNLIGM